MTKLLWIQGSRGGRLRRFVVRLVCAVGMLAIAGGLSGCANFFINTDSTTTVTSSAADAVSGASITLTATVKPSAATGTITFYDGTTSLGTGTLSSGTATLAVTTLAVGSHSITADYGGDSNYTASNSAAVTVVVSASLTTTTTTLVVSPTSAISGASVTMMATVSSTSATGNVQFYTGTTLLGASAVAVGTANFTTTALPVGTDSVTAVYTGDSTYATSTSPAVMVAITQ